VHEPITVDDQDYVHEDANSLVALFDDALCCAFDPETLEEIREEFQPKIDGLGRNYIEQAGRVFLKHEERVAGINLSLSHQAHTAHQSTEENCSDGDNTTPNHPIQERLSAKLKFATRRRPTKGFVSSRTRPISLLALNARQRFSGLQDSGNTRDESDDQTEAEPLADFNNPTSPKTSGLLILGHPDALPPKHQTVAQAEPTSTSNDFDTVDTADQ